MRKTTVQSVLLSTLSGASLGLHTEIHSSSLMERGSFGIDSCEEDTKVLDGSATLDSSFQQILKSFVESIEKNTSSYCETVKNGQNVSTICDVDYSKYIAADNYTSLCETEGGTVIPLSLAMNCSKDEGRFTLGLDLMNIPRCVGLTCDAGHLYSTTFVHILSEFEESFSIKEFSWDCSFDTNDLVILESLSELPTTPLCEENGSTLYLFKLNNKREPVTKTCASLAKKSESFIKNTCKNNKEIHGSFDPAATACPVTCGHCKGQNTDDSSELLNGVDSSESSNEDKSTASTNEADDVTEPSEENIVNSTESSLSTIECEQHTQILDGNPSLNSSFQQIIESFSESISSRFDDYCKSIIDNKNVSTQCVVDYSESSASDKYEYHCEINEGVDYPISLMMHCLRTNGNGRITASLEMDFMNIPRCFGATCNAGQLYNSTLKKILPHLEGSFVVDDSSPWNCHFHHDLEVLEPSQRLTNTPSQTPSISSSISPSLSPKCQEDRSSLYLLKFNSKGRPVTDTCSSLSRKSDLVIKDICEKNVDPHENYDPAATACPVTCGCKEGGSPEDLPTVSLMPSEAPSASSSNPPSTIPTESKGVGVPPTLGNTSLAAGITGGNLNFFTVLISVASMMILSLFD